MRLFKKKRKPEKQGRANANGHNRRTGIMRVNRKSTDSETKGSVGGTENMALKSVQPTSILSFLNLRRSQMAPTEKASTTPFQKACLNTSTGMQTVARQSTMHPTKHSISWRNGQDFHSLSASMIRTSGVSMSIRLEKRPSIMWNDHKDFPSRILS